MSELPALKELLKDSLNLRRQTLVFELAKQIKQGFEAQGLKLSSVEQAEKSWTKIDSLSALRATVGGRFQNLKDRWLAAGFPLKEKKGEPLADFVLEESAWSEMLNWLNRSGYEARLGKPEEGCLFEVKRLEP